MVVEMSKEETMESSVLLAEKERFDTCLNTTIVYFTNY
jgi:hypothetical protein